MKFKYITAVINDNLATVHSRHATLKEAATTERKEPKVKALRLTTEGKDLSFRDPRLGEALQLMPQPGDNLWLARYPQE